MRINAHAQVNDRTYVQGLLRADTNFKADDGIKGNNDQDVYMQRLYVHHDFGNKASMNIGKDAQFFGQTGMFFDGDVKGIEANSQVCRISKLDCWLWTFL